MVDQPGSRADVEIREEGTPPRIRLSTVEDVRVELARVYRDMRAGKVTMTDGGKLAYVLSMLAKVSDQSVLEAKVFELEQLLPHQKKGIIDAE